MVNALMRGRNVNNATERHISIARIPTLVWSMRGNAALKESKIVMENALMIRITKRQNVMKDAQNGPHYVNTVTNA
jgi:hypothetical protein